MRCLKREILLFQVALRKESVDRNSMGVTVLGIQHRSLSARRAWIEIDFEGKLDADLWVALRKESVDRNPPMCTIKPMPLVALRKESVDRNCRITPEK